ncbi:MAG TPA: hypothetical protein ENK35_03055 [Candidatus Tenderia sp.]|nr:hypothetical protein [Candidatus Tenderia sp.]
MTDITQPIPNDIGENNIHALQALRCAYLAAASLIEQGCDINGIITGWRNPVIQLASPPKPGVLPSGLHTRRTTNRGAIKTYATTYMGAQIEWRHTPCRR